MIDYEALVSGAIGRSLNIIAISNNEHNLGEDLNNALSQIKARIIHFDLQTFRPIDLFTAARPDSSSDEDVPTYFRIANAMYFTSMELADAEMQKAIDEMMEKRTLRGVELPLLRTVIVSYDNLDNPEEIARLQKLAPAVTVAFS